MSFAPKNVSFDFLTTSAVAVLTNTTGKKFRVSSIDLYNKHSAPATVVIWRAPNNGGSVRTVASDDRYQRIVIVILAGNSMCIDVDWVLDANNDTIQMLASVTAVVSGDISGVEETT